MIVNAINGALYDSLPLAAGKPRKGRIYLKTTEVEGAVKIEVGDDGQGLDLERIKAKAVELQIISPEQAERLTEIEHEKWIRSVFYKSETECSDRC